MKNTEWQHKMLNQYSGVSLLKALVQVMEQFNAEKKRPGSDHWIANRFGRDHLFTRIASQWSEDNKCDLHDFPFNTDGIARLWVTYRKSTTKQKKDIMSALDLSPKPNEDKVTSDVNAALAGNPLIHPNTSQPS